MDRDDLMDPRNPEVISRADAKSTWIIESQPGIWWGLYKGAMEKGFTEQQALFLVSQYIQSNKV